MRHLVLKRSSKHSILLRHQVQLASRTPGAFDAPLAVPGGADAICTAPFSAWDLDAPRNGASVQRVRFGGFVSGSAAFDAAAFGVTGAEAELMDPQQRVLMEVGIHI